MTTIRLQTEIAAPIHICFDMARNIDLHAKSMSHTSERAIAGRTSGLIEQDETVTWSAVHFGIRETFTSKITLMKKPDYFEDVMVKGAFSALEHQHYFRSSGNKTVMTDEFSYTVPGGIFGRIFNHFILAGYMKKLLQRRNAEIKRIAESEKSEDDSDKRSGNMTYNVGESYLYFFQLWAVSISAWLKKKNNDSILSR